MPQLKKKESDDYFQTGNLKQIKNLIDEFINKVDADKGLDIFGETK